MDKTNQEEFDEMVDDLNTVTNDIAADYELFVKEAQQGNVSKESIAKAKTNVAILKALGASKENPVPEPPAEPPAEGTV